MFSRAHEGLDEVAFYHVFNTHISLSSVIATLGVSEIMNNVHAIRRCGDGLAFDITNGLRLVTNGMSVFHGILLVLPKPWSDETII